MSFTLATITALLLPATILIAISILVGRQLAALQRHSQLRQDWTADLSVERYRPMFRLLAEDDIRFLLSQPGVTIAMVHRLRKQRCDVFRGYLRSLERDFQQTTEALLLVMIQSQVDRKDLIAALIGSKVKFTLGVFGVRCRLMLYRWNISEEPVVRLVNIFEGLQRELQSLEPASQAAGA